jgi:putative membrane protein
MSKASNQCMEKRNGGLAGRAAIAFGLVLIAVLASGCAPMPGPAEPGQPAPAWVAVSRLSDAERTFMGRAAARNLYEVEVSRLAASRATSPRVRSYAQMVANQDAQANNELAALMRTKGLQPPSGLAPDKTTKLHRLSALRPSVDFDRGYVRVVGVEDHIASIALFEQARRVVRDRDLRAWIDRTLPVLRTHLGAAQTLSGTLAG